MLTDTILAAAQVAQPATRLLLGLWLAHTSAQWLVAAPIFAANGLLPWAQLGRVRSARWLMATRRRMSVGVWRTLFAAQMAIAIALVGGIGGDPLLACLALAILLSAISIILTGNHWADGSDKIAMIALAGAFLSALGLRLGDPALALAGLLWTGGQLALCYAVAGLTKLRDPRWRNGQAIAGILSTDTWGHPFAARLLQRTEMRLTAAWAVILLEALFPLGFLLPWPGLALALAGMFAFHVGTAIFMGLNRFPWAFACAYPAALSLGQIVGAAPVGQ